MNYIKNYVINFKLDYRGTVRYSGFVEPLIDKNIYNLINMTRKSLPFSNIEMVTNGDPKLKRLLKLFENGRNKILISAYDSKEDAEKLESNTRSANLNQDQYIVRHRYYSEEKGYGITLSNRSGLMDNAEFKIESLKEPLKTPCYIPSYTFLDYQGDVLIVHMIGEKNYFEELK